jgi:hypothetical protein
MTLPALLATFTNNLLPVLLIGGSGFLIGKLITIDTRSIGRVAFNFFSPVLVFNLLVTSSLQLDQALSTVAFTCLVLVTMGLLAFLIGRLFKLERPLLLALILTTTFGNTGNYGLPLVKFALGDDALAFATIFFVTTWLFFNTAGVFIASLGQMDFKTALLGLFKVPTGYAVILAVIVNALNIELPLPLARTVSLAADGTIPLLLILLGLELTRVEWSHNLRALGLGASLKLLAGPVVGLLFASLLGLQGVSRQANVVQASMPPAVMSTVLASEYKLEPPLVTAIIFVSTILSPLTLTPLLVFLTSSK